MAGPEQNPIALAYEWVGRILAAVAMMVGPAWLCDRYVGPGLLSVLALVVGVVVGTAYLLFATRAVGSPKGQRKSDDERSERDGPRER